MKNEKLRWLRLDLFSICLYLFFTVGLGSITWFSQKSTEIGINFINFYDNCR